MFDAKLRIATLLEDDSKDIYEVFLNWAKEHGGIELAEDLCEVLIKHGLSDEIEIQILFSMLQTIQNKMIKEMAEHHKKFMEEDSFNDGIHVLHAIFNTHCNFTMITNSYTKFIEESYENLDPIFKVEWLKMMNNENKLLIEHSKKLQQLL